MWSEELYRIHGLDPRLPLPALDKFERLFTPESAGRFTASMRTGLRTGSIPETELEVVRPDGSRTWTRLFGEGVRDATGRTIYLRGTVQDITESKNYEATLRESQNRMMALVGSAMDAIIAVDEKQIVVVVQPVCRKDVWVLRLRSDWKLDGTFHSAAFPFRTSRTFATVR